MAQSLGSIFPSPPYAFDRLLAFLEHFRHPTLDITHQGAYWRVIQTDGVLALLRTTAAGSVETPALHVDLIAQNGDIDHQTLLSDMEHILGANTDRAAFFTMARADDRLWPVIEPVYGLPFLRSASVFEALIQAIIEQQIAWVSALRSQRWLVEWAGQCLTYGDKTFYAFPLPEQLAGAALDDLKPLKITHRRIALIIDIAAEVAAGRLDLEAIKHLPPEAACETLLKIKGIGRWTAAVTLSRAMGYDGHVTDNDVALQAAINYYFFNGEGRAAPQAVIDACAPYGDFAGTVAAYVLSRWVLDRY